MRSNMYQVSVITATYNRAGTLRTCIESVLNQDFHHFFELIVVNDGSTDDSARIIREYTRDPRVRYHNIPNGGQAKALNFGVSNAKGDYVAFIDSDDEYHPHHLSTLFNRAQETKSDFIIGNFDLILCGDQREVGDFYNRGQTISIGDVECITGVIFGRREKVMEIGGFEGEYLDIGLLDKIKKQNYRWDRCAEKTYRYYFGRCRDNLSAQIADKYVG